MGHLMSNRLIGELKNLIMSDAMRHWAAESKVLGDFRRFLTNLKGTGGF